VHRHVSVSVNRHAILSVSGAQMCWGSLLPTSRDSILGDIVCRGKGVWEKSLLGHLRRPENPASEAPSHSMSSILAE
jgi:hypothetical protein